MKTAGALI